MFSQKPKYAASGQLGLTDIDGEIFQHLEYFPFGETWVEESSNTQRTPYLFTGKELDEQTGLYYFGARYYDPRTSVWQSPDPILQEYLPVSSMSIDDLGQLRSAGGVSEPSNLNLYAYVRNKPIVGIDKHGEDYSGFGALMQTPGCQEDPAASLKSPHERDVKYRAIVDFSGGMWRYPQNTRTTVEFGLVTDSNAVPLCTKFNREGLLVAVLSSLP
jgi:RHS repeat-associated protein